MSTKRRTDRKDLTAGGRGSRRRRSRRLASPGVRLTGRAPALHGALTDAQPLSGLPAGQSRWQAGKLRGPSGQDRLWFRPPGSARRLELICGQARPVAERVTAKSKKYTPEFREEASRLVIDGSRPVVGKQDDVSPVPQGDARDTWAGPSPLYEQTPTDRQRILGTDHPQTLTSRGNLAVAYQAAGGPAPGHPPVRADPHRQRAGPRHRPPRHPDLPQQPRRRLPGGWGTGAGPSPCTSRPSPTACGSSAPTTPTP